MPYHKYNRRSTRKHVFAADGAVRLEIPFNTLVLILEVDFQTHVAGLAMIEVLVLTDTAYAAVCAMINALS